jgi:hypothetical protein
MESNHVQEIIFKFFSIILNFIIFFIISRFASNKETKNFEINGYFMITSLLSGAILLYFSIVFLNLFIEKNETIRTLIISKILIIVVLMIIMN